MPARVVHHRPITLFRYRPLRTPGTTTGRKILKREFEAIRLNQLWFGGFESLNDPMEGQFAKGLSHPLDRAAVVGEKQGIGICSFSETEMSELMWTHYADEFHGMCVAYNVASLIRGLDDDIVLSRVRYSHEVPPLDLVLNPAHAARGILGVKSLSWLYEREWRLFSPRQGLVHHLKIGRPAVRAVYLGFRMRDDHKKWLERRLTPIGIRVCTVAVSGYGLVFNGPGRLPFTGMQIETDI